MSPELFDAQDGFDAEAECRALRPGQGDTVFALAGAGDHVLALLGAAPRLVIAAEPRPAQAHLVELKLAGLKSLAYGEYLELLGRKASRRRRGLYQRVRWLLSSEAEAHWTANLQAIDAGLLAQGQRERALASFRRFVWLVQGNRRVEQFLSLADPREQADVLRREWDGFVWRRFAGRVLAGVLGRPDPDACLRRLEQVMTATPARENYLLSWLLAGAFRAATPFYLREDAFDALKSIANRVIVVCDRPDRALAGMPDESIDAFALGDGWSAVEDMGDMGAFTREIGRAGRTGARLAARTDLAVEPFERLAVCARATVDGTDRTCVPGGFWEATLAGVTACGGMPT